MDNRAYIYIKHMSRNKKCYEKQNRTGYREEQKCHFR